MTKKDYTAMAKLLRTRRPPKLVESDPDNSYRLWEQLVKDIADHYGSDNGSFDRVRFLAACGVYEQ